MPRQIQDQNLILSRAFQDKAAEADALSYRRIHLVLTHHIPGHPHLLQETPRRFYDRLETGLQDLVILRAALEYPQLAYHLVSFLSPKLPEQPLQIEDIRAGVKGQFNMQAKPGFLTAGKTKSLLRRTDAEMERCIDFLKDHPTEFTFSFAGFGDQGNIGRLNEDSAFEFLPLTRKALSDWLVKPVEGEEQPPQATAPLDSVKGELRPVLREADLKEARSSVGNVLDHGRGIMTIGRKLTLVLA